MDEFRLRGENAQRDGQDSAEQRRSRAVEREALPARARDEDVGKGKNGDAAKHDRSRVHASGGGRRVFAGGDSRSAGGVFDPEGGEPGADERPETFGAEAEPFVE